MRAICKCADALELPGIVVDLMDFATQVPVLFCLVLLVLVVVWFGHTSAVVGRAFRPAAAFPGGAPRGSAAAAPKGCPTCRKVLQ